MPGRETHKYVGAAAGLALAAAQAQEESKPHFWIEMMGGALGVAWSEEWLLTGSNPQCVPGIGRLPQCRRRRDFDLRPTNFG